jgi:predicted Zn-dependent protease
MGQSYEIAAAAALASGTGTNSAVFEGAKWDSQVITWSIADNPGTTSAPFSNYMSNAYETAIQNAFNVWSAATGLTFEEVPDSPQSDIRIGWGEFNTASSDLVGYTSYQSNSGQFSPGVIIRLEDPTQDVLVTGADGQLTYAGTQTELSQVLLHEIGHALGLGDNTDPNSVMCYALGTNNRGLDSVDLAGIQTLYGSDPKGSPASNPVNTGLDQLIQAMATFNTDEGAPVTSLTPESYAAQTYHILATSLAGKLPMIPV